MNKALFITGGAKRIGKSIAIEMAKLGYDIALHYNNSEYDARITAKTIRELKVKCEIYKADFSTNDSLKNLFDNVLHDFPNLEMLINSASIFEPDKISELTVESLTNQTKINAISPIILMNQFCEKVKKGEIINIVDSRIKWNDLNYFSYSLSKKMLADATIMAAKEYISKIRINAIAPGAIIASLKYNDKTISKNKKIKGIDRTKSILEAIKYLNLNSYVTGEILYVDGGLQLKNNL